MLKKQIEKYLKALEKELSVNNIKGEICLYGGSAMCLAFDARPSTKDVDAVFKPASIMREAAKKVAAKYNLPEGWLSDGVKGFLADHPQKVLFDWANLKVYCASAEYLLAMKALAARVDTMDKEDIIFLIKKLKLQSPDEVLKIVEKYYPRGQIRPATQFFVEEVFEK